MSIADPRVIACRTVAAYLQASMPDVKLSENWPTPGRPIAMPAITVIASPNVKTEYHSPRAWRTISDSMNPAQGKTLYSYGKAYLNLQLDCWEKFEAPRDILAQRVESFINKPARLTVGAMTTLVDYDTAPGLVLKMSGYYDTLCEYMFEPIAGSMPESSDMAQAGEWRQSYAGTAILYLCNEQQVAVLKQAVATLDLNDNPDQLVIT